MYTKQHHPSIYSLRRLFPALFFVILFGLGYGVRAEAATYYVDATNGLDTNSGTSAGTAWQTLNHAALGLHAGDTLYARGGVYHEKVYWSASGTSSSHITIANYPGETPIVDGDGLTLASWASLMAVAGNYVDLSGFELRNMNLNGAVLGGYGLTLQGTGDTARNMLVHDIWSQLILLQGDNELVEDSTAYRGALSNCRLSTAAACGVTTNSYNITPTGGWPTCVGISKPYNNPDQINHNSTIQRVNSYDCWGEGIATYDSDGAILQDNVAYNNFSVNIYANNATNVVIRRNIAYNAPDSYLGSYTPNASGLQVSDELNNGASASYNLSHDNTIVNNAIYNSTVGLFGWTMVLGTGLNNDLIANNTIITKGYFETGFGGAHTITNVGSTIANNIVDSSTFGASLYVPSNVGITLSHNLWDVTPPAQASGANDVIGNPYFLRGGSVEAGLLSPEYFKLLPTSPAIDAGTPIAGRTTDFLGHPIYGTPDIGAYEYQPPHTVGTDKLDTASGARIYGDGKFRDLTTTSGTTADLSITPQSGSFPTYNATDTRPQWMDISNITWENTGTHHKQWTETSDTIGSASTLHTVGDLEANKFYAVSVDSTQGANITGANGTTCTGGVCQSNTEGKISFTYSGGYSTHTFDVVETTDALPPAAPSGLSVS